ncbi:uncharacterized protein N7483_011076 [Penicillium malachiteum]|uniref:uncharacterized protein n=1 Tax=Penicillium malachiteum TaxID=1324776 RepID=UPI002546DFBD|nr:uncharacterized protein N7483_011076 [Penicillium malachiteum]KAJ5713895.1 hypothetical protein N7483_011076 [Penicillium malachiteum]
MATPRITLFFDLVSPFSYIAFHILKNCPVFSKCQIDYIPVGIRDLFQKCQNSPPITVKNKAQWINRERLYWSRRFGVPMSDAIPEGFPAPTSDIQTALCLIGQECPEKLRRDTKIVTRERFMAVIESQLGQETAERIKNKLENSDASEVLLSGTQRAFDNGAFGLPWFECVNTEGSMEGFWGIDHLGRLADFLKLDTSLDQGFRTLL